MPKITDPAYQLPEIIATEWVRTFRTGANCPMLIDGIDLANQSKDSFVLKYRGAERMDETTSGRELMAAWLAIELEIGTPEPVVVRVDAQFAQMVPPDFRAVMATRAQGLNFGSRFMEGKTIFQPDELLAPQYHQAAARVFIFDLLIQNGDRRPEKPNSFLADGSICLIDHELAFGFLSMLPMFANPTPWILNGTDVLAAQKHLFYPMLRQNKGVDWEAAISTLSNLTPEFWQLANDHLPEKWKDAVEIGRIRSHFESLQQHSTTFISEIWNKLIG